MIILAHVVLMATALFHLGIYTGVEFLGHRANIGLYMYALCRVLLIFSRVEYHFFS